MGAATLAATLDRIANWVETEIAPDLKYLVPPADGAVDSIDLEWAQPSVFQLFVPAVERLHSGEHQSPSIAVQFLGSDDLLKSDRIMSIRLLLSIWSPGHFVDGKFVRDSDGWRDLFNGLGVIADAVEASDTIAGCAVDMTAGVKIGLYEVEKEIPDLYPYWIGKVDFTLRRAPQANKKFEKYL